MAKRTLAEIFGPDSSSDDEEDDRIDDPNGSSDCCIPVGVSQRVGGNGLWFTPMTDAKFAKLKEISDSADRRLQQLLWELECSFDLYHHQFKGVREVAGVTEKFPGSEMIVNGSDLTKYRARRLALRNAKPRFEENDSGLILADCMGLGKTIQAVAAIVLRNAIAAARGESHRPSLVVCPNEAVLKQWKEHLRGAGLHKNRIIRFKTKQRAPLELQDNVILCTRFDLQSEMRFVMQDVQRLSVDEPVRQSPLFPRASDEILDVLHNQYLNANGSTKNRYNNALNGRKLTNEVVVTKYLRKERGILSSDPKFSKIFRMIIIDEAVSL
jgi:SNF2-related domain